jgi:hypothetical protein
LDELVKNADDLTLSKAEVMLQDPTGAPPLLQILLQLVTRQRIVAAFKH